MSQAINQVIPEGYKQTEVGVLPKDWALKTISEIASVSSGGTPNREISEFWNGDIPWITTTLINGDVISNANEFITRKGLENSSAKMCASGTILMAMYGQGKTRGKVGLLSFDASINQACAAISLHNKSSNQYVLHVLNSMYDEIRDLSNSGGQENLSGGIIKNITLPFPSCEEQTAIANALSDLDALLSELENLIAKKQAIKTATMQQLLTGKTRLPQFAFYSDINSTEDAVEGKRNNTTATIVNAGACDDDSLASQESGGMDSRRKGTKTSELGEIPEDWDVVCINEIATLIGDGIHSTPTYDSNGDYYFVNGNNIHRGKLKLTENTNKVSEAEFKKHKKNINERTLFLSINGTIGNLAYYKNEPIILGKSAAFINIKTSTSLEYAYHMLSHEETQQRFEDGLTGSTIKNLGLGTIKSTLIPIPQQEEQTAIASILSDMDNEIQTLEQRLSKTRQIKQGMMQELLTGKTRLPFARLAGESDAD
jgi:type I restriction enzyme S subunit